ncbi:MAG: cytochrome c3 family protein, partial [Burkholderiaceae bacterium]|nr:cytochrome c3 family protein [Burkholderiaceae bacterium]
MNPGQLLRSLCAILLLGGATSAIAGPNDGCLKCHTDPAAKRASGAAMPVTDAKKFVASVHGGKKGKCIECHEDAETEDGKDHAKKLKPVDCASCHDDAVAEHVKTVHGRKRAGSEQAAATCTDC